MMTTLILHIGYPKTGTSFLQLTLAENRARFRAAGLDYLGAEDVWPDGEAEAQTNRNGSLGSLLAHELLFASPEAAQQSWDRIVQRVNASVLRYCMISSEVFSMLPAEGVASLRRFTKSLDVRVLVWLRPQAEAIHSRYLQAVKAGNRLPGFSRYVEQQIASRYWHYRERLQDWEVFGRDHLLVRKYDRSAFPKGDIVRDLCRALEIDVDWNVPPQPRAANLSIGPRCFSVLKQLTEHADGYQRPSREELERAGRRHSAGFEQLDRVFGDIGWKDEAMNLLSSDIAARCDAAYQKGNASVARDFFGHGDGALFPPSSAHTKVTAARVLDGGDWIRLVAGLLRRIDQVGTPKAAQPRAVKESALQGAVAVSGAGDFPTVFHVTHYKAGSQWVYSFLSALSPDRVVKPRPQATHVTDEPIRSGAVYPTVYLTRPQLDAVSVPGDQRRVIVLRDLRDTLVSLYFSLRYSHGETDRYVTSIRNVLVGLSQKEGLLWLLENRFRLISQIHRTWLGGDDLFIKYEDLLEDEYAAFERIAGYCDIAVPRDRLHKVVKSISFERVSGRGRGEEDHRSHFRKGVSGDWRAHFDDAIKARFKTIFGDLIIQGGYERNDDW